MNGPFWMRGRSLFAREKIFGRHQTGKYHLFIVGTSMTFHAHKYLSLYSMRVCDELMCRTVGVILSCNVSSIFSIDK